MPNYQNSKIYVLRSHQTEKIYIGSTCNELRKRFCDHKSVYKMFLENKHHYISSFEILKYDDCYIELYEKYPCMDKMELHKREGEIIRSLNCVNKNEAGRNLKQFYKDKKEWYQKNSKKYYIDNKEKIKKNTKENRIKNRKKYNKIHNIYYHKNKHIINKKISCVCGSNIQKNNKARHERTTKHINFINQ